DGMPTYVWQRHANFAQASWVGGLTMDVSAWLREVGLTQYAEAFAENGIDAAMLPELNNEDLKDLGVTRLADRKRLLKAIEELSAGKEQQPEPSFAGAPAGEQRQVTVLFADI